jgi:hypothetical protein
MHPLMQFHKDTGGAFQGTVVTAAELLAAGLAAENAAVVVGDDTAVMVIKSVAQWIEHMKAAAPDQAPLCFNCDTVFAGPEQPGAFAIAIPFANRTSSLITGICARCLAKEDAATIAFRGWRKIWPDLAPAEQGSA